MTLMTPRSYNHSRAWTDARVPSLLAWHKCARCGGERTLQRKVSRLQRKAVRTRQRKTGPTQQTKAGPPVAKRFMVSDVVDLRMCIFFIRFVCMRPSSEFEHLTCSNKGIIKTCVKIHESIGIRAMDAIHGQTFARGIPTPVKENRYLSNLQVEGDTTERHAYKRIGRCSQSQMQPNQTCKM